MLSDAQVALVGQLLLLRAGEREGRELWAAVATGVVDDAHALVEAGYLTSKKSHRGDSVFRASDAAARAQSLHAVMANSQCLN